MNRLILCLRRFKSRKVLRFNKYQRIAIALTYPLFILSITLMIEDKVGHGLYAIFDFEDTGWNCTIGFLVIGSGEILIFSGGNKNKEEGYNILTLRFEALSRLLQLNSQGELHEIIIYKG
jgi:hypothetical protein